MFAPRSMSATLVRSRIESDQIQWPKEAFRQLDRATYATFGVQGSWLPSSVLRFAVRCAYQRHDDRHLTARQPAVSIDTNNEEAIDPG